LFFRVEVVAVSWRGWLRRLCVALPAASFLSFLYSRTRLTRAACTFWTSTSPRTTRSSHRRYVTRR